MGGGCIYISKQQRSLHLIPASDAKPWPSAAAAALMVKLSRLDSRSLNLCWNEASTLSGRRHAASAALLCLVPEGSELHRRKCWCKNSARTAGHHDGRHDRPCSTPHRSRPSSGHLSPQLLGACAMIGGLAAQRVTPLFESGSAVIAPCALNRVSVRDDSWTSTPLCRLH